MRYRITHTTRYTGSEPVSVGHNQAWLTPRDLPAQQCLRHRLAITPRPSTRTERTDYFGNSVTDFSFNRGYDELTVTARSEMLVLDREAPATDESPPWETLRDAWRTGITPEHLPDVQFRYESPRTGPFAELADYAAESFAAERPILSAVADLTRRIHQDFQYEPQSTTVTTPVRDVFHDRKGVCQDFAHLEITALRSLGIPARYVSGYLRTYAEEGKPRLLGADASHAWLGVYCGELGWIDVDPTNNVFTSGDHITVAWGRDYGDVPPLRGVFVGGGSHKLAVSVDVEPLEEFAPADT